MRTRQRQHWAEPSQARIEWARRVRRENARRSRRVHRVEPSRLNLPRISQKVLLALKNSLNRRPTPKKARKRPNLPKSLNLSSKRRKKISNCILNHIFFYNLNFLILEKFRWFRVDRALKKRKTQRRRQWKASQRTRKRRHHRRLKTLMSDWSLMPIKTPTLSSTQS